ncbi:SurA N-terminal domain-containing protein [Acuticoccus sp. I52.16.1]|uniref:SurA N-terminal domain-containing protein n=1 Tax=Acuticoccus sp. I52.16.1 TaxID=2928472 RepID=UPI001FD0DC38|nr:SurA N-terminal domain-containing protein [Acuticoccus sp. I52.16.1]UOM35303.1 SurA N-terminal domain-containing protein [Acuticoccus sp. I52.16.1]
MFRIAYCLAVVLSLLAAPVSAQTTIKAVVNGKPITSYDVAQRERLLRITGNKGNLTQKALDELIDEELQLEAARQNRVTVPAGSVDRAIGSIAERVKLSPSQLAQALAQAGVNIQTLRDRLEAQIAFNQLTRTRFGDSLKISEPDLVAALLKKKDAETVADSYEYDLSRVMVAMPEDPSQARRAEAVRIANSVRSQFNNCETGLPMAKKTREVVVLPYGRRTHAELPTQLADAIENIDQGKLTEPIPTPQGLLMLAVCKKTAVRSTNAAMKALENDMQAERNEAFTRQYIRQLRRDAAIEIR